jgi:hypothetical protein
MLTFMREIRESIQVQQFDAFVEQFLLLNFPKQNVPQWVLDALQAAGLTIRASR